VPRPRLRDVADLAGVDISVASRALRRSPELSVRPETQRRIEEAASALGYVANPAAASLKTARTSSLGIVLPNLFNPAGSLIALGATEQAAAAGYLLLVTNGTPRDSVPMLERRVDGILLASATNEPRSMPDAGSVEVPLLLVNRHEPGGFPGIVVDDERGAELATEYLVSLGHVDIGHVAGPQQADTSRRRRAGFEAMLRQSGLPVRGEWIAEGPFDEAGGHNAASRILAMHPRPTALFVSNLLATVGVMAAARQLGLKIPDDLSLITFDDVSLAMYLDPPVTTIRLPLPNLGRQAVNALVGMIEGGEQGDVVIHTPPEIVLRQSCTPPKLT
jgi:LacI family transcriptional regulator